MRAADADTPRLPKDPAALRMILLEMLARCGTLSTELGSITAERDALASQNERLQHLLLKLKRRQFGRKSEQLPEDQLLFAFEEIEATLAENAAEAGKTSPALRDGQRKRRRARRGRLPAHLPRIEQVLAPARLIEGGVPTEATVAHVLVSRYADHLPLYRQSQILARQGIEIGREVLADWTGTAAMEIVPVVRRMREILLASPRLFADETTMPVLDPGRGRTKKG